MIELLFPSQQSGFLSWVVIGEGEYESCFEFLDCIFVLIAEVFLYVCRVTTEIENKFYLENTFKMPLKCLQIRLMIEWNISAEDKISLWDAEILWSFWSLFSQQYVLDFIVGSNLWHLWWFTKVKNYICILSILLCCTPFSFFILLLTIFQEALTSQSFLLITDCWIHMVRKITLGYLFLTEYIVSHLKWWHGTNINQQNHTQQFVLCFKNRLLWCFKAHSQRTSAVTG